MHKAACEHRAMEVEEGVRIVQHGAGSMLASYGPEHAVESRKQTWVEAVAHPADVDARQTRLRMIHQ